MSHIDVLNWSTMPVAIMRGTQEPIRFTTSGRKLIENPNQARAAAAPTIVHNVLERLLDEMSYMGEGYLAIMGLPYAEALIKATASLPEVLRHPHPNYENLLGGQVKTHYDSVIGLSMAVADIDGITRDPKIDLGGQLHITLACITLVREAWAQGNGDTSNRALGEYGTILI